VGALKLALLGDIMLSNRPALRDCPDDRFHSLIETIGGADLRIGQLETVLHDYEGDELYPSVEAGWEWMRTPTTSAAELTWMGLDAVTVASNHALDFSYGGLRSTLGTLDEHGIAHAGTGLDLDQAAAPAFVRAKAATVGVISICSSAPTWSRAGSPRGVTPGRPGVNTLRYAYVLDGTLLEQQLSVWEQLGLWVSQVSDDEWWVNPPGLHNSITRFRRATNSSVTSTPDELDLHRHLETIERARSGSEILVVHLHSHEWHPQRGLTHPADFVIEFAHRAVDAGACIVFAQGSHAPMRGIEIYNGSAILYDPGDFMNSGGAGPLPMDFFDRHRHALTDDLRTAEDREVFMAGITHYIRPVTPAGGYAPPERPRGGVVAQCEFGDGFRFKRLQLTPFEWMSDGPYAGIPRRLEGDEAEILLRHMGALSADFGTHVEIDGGVGIVTS
jgi:poly-gamma-glutamate synthesis protein (capsule biosynthesis protein)